MWKQYLTALIIALLGGGLSAVFAGGIIFILERQQTNREGNTLLVK